MSTDPALRPFFSSANCFPVLRRLLKEGMANTKNSSASTLTSNFGNALQSFRIVMLGQYGTGKSNIAQRFVSNTYDDHHKMTVGAEFQTKRITLSNGKYVNFEIWDTCGQEQYSWLAPLYYRGADAAIVVYDITDQTSYDRAKTWIHELRQQNACSDTKGLVLVGNKLDLENQYRDVDLLGAVVYASDKNLLFAEVSAKTGFGIRELFEALALRLCNASSVKKSSTRASVINLRRLSDEGSSKSCLCGSVAVRIND